MEKSPAARANAMAAKAEDYASKGMWSKSAKAHLQCASMYYEAMQHTTDAEVLRTLQLLYSNHARCGKELSRKHQITDSVIREPSISPPSTSTEVPTTTSHFSTSSSSTRANVSHESQSPPQQSAQTKEALVDSSRQLNSTQNMRTSLTSSPSSSAGISSATQNINTSNNDRNLQSSKHILGVPRREVNPTLYRTHSDSRASTTHPYNSVANIDQSYFLMGSDANASFHNDRAAQLSSMPPQPVRSFSTNEIAALSSLSKATIVQHRPAHIFGLHDNEHHNNNNALSNNQTSLGNDLSQSTVQVSAQLQHEHNKQSFSSFWDVIDSLVARISSPVIPSEIYTTTNSKLDSFQPPSTTMPTGSPTSSVTTAMSVIPSTTTLNRSTPHNYLHNATGNHINNGHASHMNVAESFFMVPNTLGESYLRPPLQGTSMYGPIGNVLNHHHHGPMPSMLPVRQYTRTASILSLSSTAPTATPSEQRDIPIQHNGIEFSQRRTLGSLKGSQMSSTSGADSQSRASGSRGLSTDENDVESVDSVVDNEKEVLRKRVEELEGFVSRLMTDKTRSESSLQGEKETLTIQVDELRHQVSALQEKQEYAKQQTIAQTTQIQRLRTDLTKERDTVQKYKQRWEKLKVMAKRKQLERESSSSSSLIPSDNQPLHAMLISGEHAELSPLMPSSSSSSSSIAAATTVLRSHAINDKTVEDHVVPLQERFVGLGINNKPWSSLIGSSGSSMIISSATYQQRQHLPLTSQSGSVSESSGISTAFIPGALSPISPASTFLAYSPPMVIQRPLFRHGQVPIRHSASPIIEPGIDQSQSSTLFYSISSLGEGEVNLS